MQAMIFAGLIVLLGNIAALAASFQTPSHNCHQNNWVSG